MRPGLVSSISFAQGAPAVTSKQDPHSGKQFLFGLLSLADLMLTWWLLRQSPGQVYEANPIAGWLWARHGAAGLVCFKGLTVLLVLGLAGLIARDRPRAAGCILGFGCASLVVVVGYSATLCRTALRSPEERAAIEAREEQQYLDTINGETQEWQQRREGFLAFRKKLIDALSAGRCTLREAVDRLAASEQARNSGWVRGLKSLDPEGSVAERLATYLIFTIVQLAEEPDAARVALRLEQEFQATYGRSVSRRYRDFLPVAGPEGSLVAREAF
jgi:hypothetical protein